jgi:hypothetical protein
VLVDGAPLVITEPPKPTAITLSHRFADLSLSYQVPALDQSARS